MSSAVAEDATPGTDPAAAHRPPRSRAMRDAALVTGVLALTMALMLAGYFALTANGAASPARPAVFERLSPGVGSAMLRQDDVGVDLPSGMWCSLTIDGIPIPDAQLSVANKASGECMYRPGPGKVIAEFQPGPHSATIRYFPANEPTAAQSFEMPFSVY